jgi:hypothetical protein
MWKWYVVWRGGIASMSSAGVRFGKTTCGGWESDTFARLLSRLLGLLIIAINYDGIRTRCDAMQYKSSQSGMWYRDPCLVQHVSAAEGIRSQENEGPFLTPFIGQPTLAGHPSPTNPDLYGNCCPRLPPITTVRMKLYICRVYRIPGVLVTLARA